MGRGDTVVSVAYMLNIDPIGARSTQTIVETISCSLTSNFVVEARFEGDNRNLVFATVIKLLK